MKIANNKKLMVGGLMMFIVTAAGFSMANDNLRTEKETLMKTFPNMKLDGFRESPLKGLYEITAGEQVFYFSPEGYLFFGEIWTKDGKNLTAEMREKVVTERINSLPLDKALKIGNGPKKVIEFTDPDCPYCRKVDNFLSKRTDVTRYVYFVPLRRIHPDAEKKARYILSQSDRDKAFHDVFEGVLDGKPISITDDTQQQQLEEMEKIAAGLGVRGTPALWIEGAHVNGADIQRITGLLDKGKEVSKPQSH
ncbi:thiol:disulfide interchange protein DsbC [Trichlorobacter thiogenes]|uniref:Thiol:disulfide interchange protein DsbC n=1 Tax=Trichlorobacter thiogenes TaxID=115783 RepID=A0A1T4KKV7_9BACT|nr:DsbC family protein [Trichlorobacter thiogenes]SJZ43072.1 thiol:disulfide interchange protein DsbC [Trichlorobacter thiogenes]